MNKSISQKDRLLQTLLKSDKKKQNKVINTNSVGKTNTKGSIDVKAKNRKSQ
jgi:hypothetical protein